MGREADRNVARVTNAGARTSGQRAPATLPRNLGSRALLSAYVRSLSGRGTGLSTGYRLRSSVYGTSGCAMAPSGDTGHGIGGSTVNRCALLAAASNRVRGGASN